MTKYHVLNQSAALALGIIDAEGNELEHTATQARIADVAFAESDIYAMALAEARQSGIDCWVIDECGDSLYVSEKVAS